MERDAQIEEAATILQREGYSDLAEAVETQHAENAALRRELADARARADGLAVALAKEKRQAGHP